MSTRTLSLFLLLVIVGNMAEAIAQPGASPAAFSGLDVTILIDQSGSMWQNPRNDRYAHRIGQTKNLIYRLAEHVEGTPLVHRVSVIDFGDTAAVALSNHVLQYDPADPGGALRDAKAAVERAVTDKPLRNTNTGDAMRLALAEYSKMQPAAPGRRRVMLIVTDGRPDVPGRSLSDMRAAVRIQAQLLAAQNVEIWVVGLNDASNYWNEGDGKFWEDVTGRPGRARLAETASSKIFTIMQEIVGDWIGSKSVVLSGDEYNCPPYLRRIVFSMNTAQPRSAAGVTDPEGKDIPAASGGPSTNPGNFARFVVDGPKIGIYKVKRDPARSYAWRVEQTSADIKRLMPARATGLEAPVRILFQARGSKGTPLKMLAEYPINGVIVFTPAIGAPTALKAEFLGDGKFLARWQPPALGFYRVRLKGLVRLKDGSEVDVFESNASSYDETLEVNNRHSYFVRFDDPNAHAGFRVFRPAGNAALIFSVVDSKGARVANLPGLVRDPASWLKLEFVDRVGAPLGGAPVSVAPSADGTFSSTAPALLRWTRGEGWLAPGFSGVRFVEEAGRFAADSYLDSIELPEKAEGQRIGGDPLAVAIPVRFSWFILGPVLAVGLVLVLSCAFVFTKWAMPKAIIWYADRSHGRTVTMNIYDADSDPDGLYGQKYSITGSNKFNYNRTYSFTTDERDYIAVILRVRRVVTIDRVEAEVTYSWDNDPKKIYSVHLRKGRIERLKGLPRDDHAISLEEKS